MPALLLAVMVLLGATAASASARTITWSGFEWDVRPAGVGSPGPNHWSDSTSTVRVEGSDLVLSIARDAAGNWTTGEIDGRRSLGYGTYRWVVKSDLSRLDAHDVLGMFTYGGGAPSYNEIDIEPAHWGNLDWASGSATVWQDPATNLRESRTFDYSPHPPYVNQFTWAPGRVHFLIVDATGARLLDWTATVGIPEPSTEVPVLNYWRYQGVAPDAPRSMRIASFEFFPPGQAPAEPAAAALPAASPPPAAPAPAAAAPPAATVRMRLARTGARRRGAALRWRATAPARVLVRVERRSRRGRYTAVMRFRRTLRRGSGTIRLASRRLGRGRYRLELSTQAPARLTPRRLAFSR